jgi:hypothetical protein
MTKYQSFEHDTKKKKDPIGRQNQDRNKTLGQKSYGRKEERKSVIRN